MYHPLPDITSEQARNTRAQVWAFVFECFYRRSGKEGGPVNRPNDAEGGSNDIRADTILPKEP